MRHDYFLICPVRSATERQKAEMKEAIDKLESSGKTVYYPARDTDQNDSIGLRICADNKSAIEKSGAVLLYFDTSSTGTLFDLGMAFAMGKRIKIINEIPPTVGKSFSNMVIAWRDCDAPISDREAT